MPCSKIKTTSGFIQILVTLYIDGYTNIEYMALYKRFHAKTRFQSSSRVI